MTSSLLPWKRFDDKTWKRADTADEMSQHSRRLISRRSSIRRNINMKFDKRTVPSEDKLTCSGKINIKCHFELKVIENFDRSQRNSTYSVGLRRKTKDNRFGKTAPLQTKIDF